MHLERGFRTGSNKDLSRGVKHQFFLKRDDEKEESGLVLIILLTGAISSPSFFTDVFSAAGTFCEMGELIISIRGGVTGIGFLGDCLAPGIILRMTCSNDDEVLSLVPSSIHPVL